VIVVMPLARAIQLPNFVIFFHINLVITDYHTSRVWPIRLRTSRASTRRASHPVEVTQKFSELI